MGCLSDYTLKGIMSDCNPVLSGIKRVYLGYRDSFEVTPNYGTQTATISTSNGGKLYVYDIKVETGGLTSTFTRNDANGIRYYTNTIAMQFTKMEKEKHLEVQAMGAEELIAIVETNDKKYWLVGADSYVTTIESTAQSGSSFDELNGYQISLSQRSAYLPFEINYADFETYIDKREQEGEGV